MGITFAGGSPQTLWARAGAAATAITDAQLKESPLAALRALETEWPDSSLNYSARRCADDAGSEYRALQNLGYADAFMQVDGRDRQFTFWDYQAGAWRRDHGIRIDHLLLSPQAADRLDSVRIHRDARAMDKASDHVPIIATFRT